MNRARIFLSLIAVLAAALGFSVPKQAWARYYNSGIYDNFGGSAVDALGNVYLAGTRTTGTVTDIVVVKYSGAGALLWARTYNGPQGKSDTGYAVAVDAGNNVFVAGTVGAGNMIDAVLLKYSPAGAFLFARTYTQAEPSSDGFTRVAVDLSGNVYAAGTTQRSAGTTGQDALVRKYSNVGGILWTRVYNSGAKNNDNLRAFHLAGNSAPYLGLSSQGTYSMGIVAKLNAATGATLFQKIQGTGSIPAEFQTFAFDAAGNPVAAFTESYGETGKRVAFLKWATANGALQMAPKYYSVTNFVPQFYTVYGLGVDSTGAFRALVGAGQFAGLAFKSEVRLVKFTLAGVKSWDATLVPIAQGATAAGLAMDGLGNAFSWASVGNPRFPKMWRHSTAGAKVWEFLPTRPQPRMSNMFQMMRKSTGELYLTGLEHPTSTDVKADFLVFKITGG